MYIGSKQFRMHSCIEHHHPNVGFDIHERWTLERIEFDLTQSRTELNSKRLSNAYFCIHERRGISLFWRARNCNPCSMLYLSDLQLHVCEALTSNVLLIRHFLRLLKAFKGFPSSCWRTTTDRPRVDFYIVQG